LNVHGLSDVKQQELHTSEPLVPNPSSFEVEIAITKLKRYKLPGRDQILAELIEAGGETYGLRSVSLLILIGIRKDCLSVEGVYYCTSSHEW
jgi:hypothetical protein